MHYQDQQTKRNNELAKIHIAKKDLAMEEDTYRQIIREVGGARSGSSADLDLAGRSKVLKHFADLGWKPRRRRSNTSHPDQADANATPGQVDMITAIWLRLGAAGVVKDTSRRAMRTWLMNTTRRYHPRRVGYSDPRFLPNWVAVQVIEQLKAWAERCEVDWRD
ncbi:MAG: regulatory protein GemA [Pseudomonadota bacterium]|nr:regulatory protein GemA [Pseudomonadota bacterium]